MSKVTGPKGNWGGSWTEIKLDAFEEYVSAYLTIMNKQKEKYKGWPKTIYFDGFAGSGERSLPDEIKENLFLDYLVKEELAVYKGSAERVLKLQQKFDYYFFIDDDETAIKNLEQNLSEKNLISVNCRFINDDVNKQLMVLSKFIDKQKTALVFLDPFGMQINWSTIETLKDKRVDIWILIPSGVIINRLLDKQGSLTSADKLESYFGLSVDEIRNKFYKTEQIDTLFGKEMVIRKINDTINKIAELYIERLKKIWLYVTPNPLKLYNTKNVPIYHFVFASNNESALKIAKQIIEKKNK